MGWHLAALQGAFVLVLSVGVILGAALILYLILSSPKPPIRKRHHIFH